jgi:tryptophanyl-tRNA synthetase
MIPRKMKKRILSGMRPTGKLHLGNYLGVLSNWLKLQEEYECYFEVADWHALTTDYENTEAHSENILDMVADWIAAGIDPDVSTVFVQSQNKTHAELHLLLSMIVTVPRLERNPTLKEQVRELKMESNIGYGHLGYPVLQAADILAYRAHVVPVGEDQLPHLELTREIARRFNHLYGDVFPVPEPVINRFARLPGTDGNRMSKSVGNVILLADDPETIRKKVKTAFTDPKKLRKGDPGHPEGCPIFAYHGYFDPEALGEIEEDCKKGTLGCVDCKKRVAERIIEALTPVREKRESLRADDEGLKATLREGAERARSFSEETLAQVRKAMKLWED